MIHSALHRMLVSLENMGDEDCDDTYEYHLEVAVFETQRWLPEVTGEPNLDNDDLPRSLREGKQLRILANILLKEEVFLFNEPSTTSAVFSRCRIRHEYEAVIADDDWISQFLVIANARLNIFPKYLFRHSDLCPVDKGSKPYLSSQSQRSSGSFSWCPQQDALRRICVTVIKLAALYEKQQPKNISRVKLFDSKDAERLLKLHRLRQQADNNPCYLHIAKRRTSKFETRHSANNRIIENKNMLPRFLNDLPTVERDTPTLPKTPPSTMNHAPDPTTPRVITTRRLSTYNETPVPQPFVQPVNQLSATMAKQAAKQTSIMERQKKERSQLKEKVMLNNNEDKVFEQVTEWRNRRRMRVQSAESATVASPLSMPLHVNQPHSRQIHYRSYFNDSQEQVIIASPKPDEASEDSGLENTTPEVSPPGDPQSRTTWRHDSVSSDRSFSSDDKSSDSPIKEELTEVTMKTRYLGSDKRSLEASPPISEDEASLRSTLVHGTHVRDTYLHQDKHHAHDLRATQLERSATANFMCRKDHNEAALCKAIVSQAALEEARGTFRPAPLRTKSGKYNSVRIEIEANRENHARVAAVKTIHTSQKQTAQASIFKPMCELIEEDLQRRRALYTGAGSISPASSSKSSEFSADNGSLDRMSFGSGHMSDYKVVALDAKPEPGKLTEFVPEVERHKRVHREEPEYVISTVSHSAHFESSTPNDTAIVVRNWDLSDEERLVTKSGNNNDDDKASEKSYEPPQHHHRHHHHHNRHHEQEVKFEQPSLPVLGKSADLEFSPDIPTVVLPKKKDRKGRSKSVNSNKSSRSIKSILSHKSHKSAKSTKSDSSQESFKSAASKAPEPLRSKNPTHSDTDSVPSPEPVALVKSKRTVESDDDDLQVTLNSRATEVEELNDTSSSEGDHRLKKHHHHHHKKIVTSETIVKGDDSELEETLHYAESKVHIHDEDEKQYANVNNDTLRSSATESTIAESMRHSAADRVTPIERRDAREYHAYSPNREPLFYDTVARYGFDTSGGYHAPKHLYRREIPIYVEEPRHTPKDMLFEVNGPLYSPNSEPYIVAKEDETKISRTTYRFYDRNMQELSRNTMVNEARRVTRSYEDGIDQPIEELESAYYPYAGSADRKWVRNQGYPKPFEPSSKNYVDADSKFRIMPKENSHRPHFTKVQHKKKDTPTPEPTVDEALQVYEDARHPSGAPQHRPDPFSEEALELRDKQSKGVLTVSGKLRCAHCGMELGRGSAMIIEALGLFYHINCFRCHVCDKSLGSGTHTTDVRVRDGKLHCEKCYSNEDIGVRLSEI